MRVDPERLLLGAALVVAIPIQLACLAACRVFGHDVRAPWGRPQCVRCGNHFDDPDPIAERQEALRRARQKAGLQ